ncbi:HlyD family type I secretion periplasmic adaptor subunit [Alsobacter metallidurans]|uniref:Membrane fusion protein (MFP) family protein n=2 Tax=Alsobacter metallidurans TaxID=340221 RepID=A0A917I4Q3_9HYPH|nr:HlyD family type I secretion periplasmic adaptor subunit [Alsobacter metallidurans]
MALTDSKQKTPAAAPLPFPRQTDRIAKGSQTIFVGASAVGLASFIAWASLTSLEKVTRGSGRVIPQLQNQTVQHFEGGILTEILVREGETVEKGAPLLRIENSFSRAELQQAKLEIMAREVKLARLAAEANGQPFTPPTGLDGPARTFAEREQTVYDSRRLTLNEQMAIVDEQSRQKQLELSELRSRWTNTVRERDLVNQRVKSLRRLTELGAVSSNDLLEGERALQQIESRMSDLSHEIPRTESALVELTRRRSETALRFASDAEKERSEVALQQAKLQESALALQDRSQRSDVISPMSGVVNKLYVSTVGGVVKSGEPLAVLVPVDSAIAVEARLSPSDRAEVWPGLPAIVKISAYDYSVYGGLKGRITEVSPDALQDERGQSYFRVRLEAESGGFGPDRPVVPGMTADVDILSGKRTILSTLLRPVRNLRDNALRQ